MGGRAARGVPEGVTGRYTLERPNLAGPDLAGMETAEHYRETTFAVELVDGRKPDRDERAHDVPDDDFQSNSDQAFVPADGATPVDGWITFYWPDRDPDEAVRVAASFPFRDHREDSKPWKGAVDGEEDVGLQVFRWLNPEDPLAEITLEPALGAPTDDLEAAADDDVTIDSDFRARVENGDVSWL